MARDFSYPLHLFHTEAFWSMLPAGNFGKRRQSVIEDFGWKPSMKKMRIKSVRFEKIHLHNYGIFLGSHDFVFERQRTIIRGAGG